MISDIQIASGSVTGTTHTMAGRANQDAVCRARGDDYIIAVVADGVSEGQHSEVGAQIGAYMTASAIADQIPGQLRCKGEINWGGVAVSVEHELFNVVRAMGGGDERSMRMLVNQFFLFTLVACVITPTRTEIATIGDGFAVLNGGRIDMPPYPGNMPPCLAYRLVGSSIPREHLRWNVRASIATDDLKSFVIGTDGMADYAGAADLDLPRQPGVKVGPVSALWENDRHYRNADALRRSLAICQGGAGPRAGIGGLLTDDTTVVVGRRVSKPVEANHEALTVQAPTVTP